MSQPPIPGELWEQIPAAAQAALLLLIQGLVKRLAELERRLGQNSSNPSIPPSANPLGAPKPVAKKKSYVFSQPKTRSSRVCRNGLCTSC
jgi:hypothetical protein